MNDVGLGNFTETIKVIGLEKLNCEIVYFRRKYYHIGHLNNH